MNLLPGSCLPTPADFSAPPPRHRKYRPAVPSDRHVLPSTVSIRGGGAAAGRSFKCSRKPCWTVSSCPRRATRCVTAGGSALVERCRFSFFPVVSLFFRSFLLFLCRCSVFPIAVPLFLPLLPLYSVIPTFCWHRSSFPIVASLFLSLPLLFCRCFFCSVVASLFQSLLLSYCRCSFLTAVALFLTFLLLFCRCSLFFCRCSVFLR